MIRAINVRFYAMGFPDDIFEDHDVPEDSQPDIFEISESDFTDLKRKTDAPIDYERHTVFDNGCRQVCLMLDMLGER